MSGRKFRKKILNEVSRISRFKGPYQVLEVREDLKKIMWRNVTVMRDRESLTKAIEVLQQYKRVIYPQLYVNDEFLVEALELRNMIEVSLAIATAALAREESRGGHYRVDHPYRDDERWVKIIAIKKENHGLSVSYLSPRYHNLVPNPIKIPVFLKTF